MAMKTVFHSLAARLGLREIGVLGAMFAGAAMLLLFGLLAEEVAEGDTHKIDVAILQLFRTAGSPADLIGPDWFEEMVRDITALGSYAFVFIVMVASLGYLLLVRKYHLALLLLAAEIGGILLSNILKYGFNRPRPDMDHAAQVFTPSFPSGHATLSAVTFLTLGALLTRVNSDRRAKVYFLGIAVILTIMVGISRIYLGVHYPSDVLAGWCIGSGWAAACWGAALWLQHRGEVERPHEETPPR